MTHLLVPRYSGPPAHELSPIAQGKGCIPYDPLLAPPYNYIPHVAPGVIFVVCFALAMCIHLPYMVMSRKWWYAAMWIGAMAELMGWAARLYSHWCPYNNSAFVMQIAILIIAPCFFSAALYYIEAELIKKWGQQHALIPAKYYLWIFIGADLLSIAVQGAGGGLASKESVATPKESTATGTHTMIAGIIIQLVSMSFFSMLLFYTMYSARANWLTGPNLAPDARRMKLVFGATICVDAFILARNYYRAVELGEGWKGNLMVHETYFCVLDAALMVFVVGTFALVPPQFLIKNDVRTAAKSDSFPSDSEMVTADSKPNPDERIGGYQTRPGEP